VVAKVTAAGDKDSSLMYSIVPGHESYTNRPAVFTIDEADGTLRLSEERGNAGKWIGGLDRETVATFELMIRAETRTSPALVAHTHVTVQVYMFVCLFNILQIHGNKIVRHELQANNLCQTDSLT